SASKRSEPPAGRFDARGGIERAGGAIASSGKSGSGPGAEAPAVSAPEGAGRSSAPGPRRRPRPPRERRRGRPGRSSPGGGGSTVPFSGSAPGDDSSGDSMVQYFKRR